MNTSFSISSHAMRQRKLLRNITFELKQLAGLDHYGDDAAYAADASYNNHHNKSHHMNSGKEWQYGGYHSLFLKGVGCNDQHEVTLSSLLSNSSSLSSSNRQIVEYILRVMESVHSLLLEEYYERRTCDNSHGSRSARGNKYLDNDDDSILAALEFLNLAWSSLESDLVFASLGTFIDCEGFRCVYNYGYYG